jgi:DNA-binding NtrC family response regulator
MAEKILIVDDEPELLELLQLVIEEKTRHQVVTTTNPLEVRTLLEGTSFDLVITDLKMPHLGGIELIETIRKIDPGLPVIVLTAYGTIESAVEALQKGAFSYVTKPFKIDEILINIEKALVFERIKKENVNLRRELDLRRRSPFLIGKSPAMKKINQTILEVSNSEAAVLISGEPGTGRELVAKAIHFQSHRKDNNFLTFTCSAIPENLLEGELFGYPAGTYPGTLQDKKGMVEEAEGGTLFLDEVGELNLYNQTKLLRLLQEGEYKPLGSNASRTANLRIMASTGQDLKEKLKRRDFREDLYYRLSVIQVPLLPLRERKEDIPALAQHFLEKYGRINQKEIRGIHGDALEVLLSWDWPGNIRELETVIERGVIFCKSELLTIPDLVLPDRPTSTLLAIEEELFSQPIKEARERLISHFNAEYIKRILAKHKGNVSLAAQEIGLRRPYLHRLMKESDIKARTFKQID